MKSFVFMHRAALFSSITSVALLTACGQLNPANSTASRTEPTAKGNTVEGTVSWVELIALPADAELMVLLQDTSIADAPAKQIAKQTISLENLHPPFRYQLNVNANSLNSTTQYTVRAQVTSNAGKTLEFISDTANFVLTNGAGNKVDMVLKRVGR